MTHYRTTIIAALLTNRGPLQKGILSAKAGIIAR
jgi:hypothetical protein